MTDLVVTWPKVRPLDSYLAELRTARRNGELINYRLGRTLGVEVKAGERLYRVHDGVVRGYTPMIEAAWRGHGEVKPVGGRVAQWPAGFYIVCEPIWVEIAPVLMAGFRGVRRYLPKP